MNRDSIKNRLLQRLAHEDWSALAPHFERVTMQSRDVLVRAHSTIEHVYFPEDGLLSVHARKGPGGQRRTIEVAVIGVEGMSDMVSSTWTPLEARVWVPGSAYRIEHGIMLEHAQQSISLADLVMRFHQYMIVHHAYTSLSHGAFTAPQRIARWLLMASDRVGENIPVVHEDLAQALAIRRAGVSDALARLKARGLITTTRGHTLILDRDALIDMASGGYGQSEAEYARIFSEM